MSRSLTEADRITVIEQLRRLAELVRPSDRRTRTPQACYLGVWSGAKGNRTLDLFHAMEALYQLSYSPEMGERSPVSLTARQCRTIALDFPDVV